jgi:hypothetical protein
MRQRTFQNKLTLLILVCLFSTCLLSCTKQRKCEVWEIDQQCYPKTTYGCGYYTSGNLVFQKLICKEALNNISQSGIDTVENSTEKIVVWRYVRKVE